MYPCKICALQLCMSSLMAPCTLQIAGYRMCVCICVYLFVCTHSTLCAIALFLHCQSASHVRHSNYKWLLIEMQCSPSPPVSILN